MTPTSEAREPCATPQGSLVPESTDRKSWVESLPASPAAAYLLGMAHGVRLAAEAMFVTTDG